MSSRTLALAASSPSELYTQSVAEINAFVSWIEVQSVPPVGGDPAYAQAAAAFDRMKADAMRWINEVYPAGLQMPAALVMAGNTITPALATLTTVAAQYAADPTNQALHQVIAEQATLLASEVAALRGQMSALAVALQDFARVLGADQQGVNAALQGLFGDMQSLQNQLSQLFAQLHALQSATCPDKNKIHQCQSLIQSTQQHLMRVQQLAGLCQRAQTLSSTALQGLSYLAGYWGALAVQAGEIVPLLQAAATDPALVVQLDLQTASQAWAQLLSLSQQTVGQLAATPALKRVT